MYKYKTKIGQWNETSWNKGWWHEISTWSRGESWDSLVIFLSFLKPGPNMWCSQALSSFKVLHHRRQRSGTIDRAWAETQRQNMFCVIPSLYPSALAPQPPPNWQPTSSWALSSSAVWPQAEVRSAALATSQTSVLIVADSVMGLTCL